MLSFVESVKICVLKKPFNFKDRACRSEFWWFFLFGQLITILINKLGESSDIGYWVHALIWLSILGLTISAAIRRLHDLNKSGWLMVIPYLLLFVVMLADIVDSYNQWSALLFVVLFLDFIYLVGLLIYMACEGTKGPNRFGEDPLVQESVFDFATADNSFRSHEHSSDFDSDGDSASRGSGSD